ncbi:prefoldin subunit 2-like [Montipora capricornis]|uniref:prefoldin subunit 2-like n=1 Tax=Montipora capricornis TaxID=246305 RepID=UPI0035F1351F
MAAKKKSKGGLDHQEIIMQFNQMRQEVRGIIGKLGELEMEVNEHSIVIEALKSVEPERRCFRMIGGVLVERTVKDVLPALENNKEQIGGLIGKLKESLLAKEKQLSAFKEKHNIHVRGEKESTPTEDLKSAEKSSGVLVAQDGS